MRAENKHEAASTQLDSKEAVKVSHVARSFGNNQAVTDISFAVQPNEIFALLGPNGSGKSTLLRMLCGFLQPSSGDISILGHSLLREPREAKSAIGYVPDQGGLYLHQSVQRFLGFIAAAKNIPTNKRPDSIDYAISTLSLEGVLHKRISTLSRGYRQRVSLAQALLNRPKIIFMDEPTNGLDPTQIRQWRDLMHSLKQSASVILTSHVLDEVSALADRVGLLVEGRLVGVESLNQETEQLLLITDKDGVGAVESNASINIEAVSERGDGLAAIRINLSGMSAHAVIAALVEQGVRVHEARRVAADLESLFSQATESRFYTGTKSIHTVTGR